LLREPKKIVQTLVPRNQSLNQQTSGQFQTTPSSGSIRSRRGPVDINDLPPVDRGAGSIRTDRVVQATAIDTDDSVTVRIPTRVDATRTSLGRFGWADDYSRLRGQLEYRESDRHWKLRYIPFDGQTDDFGGSVVIEDPASLSGYERGDFVEIHGCIAKPAAEGADFAPLYHVAEIRRLEE